MPDFEYLPIFRENVLAIMARRQISLRQMATDLGTSASYLHGALKGETSPNLTRAEEIAAYLETPLPKLLKKKSG